MIFAVRLHRKSIWRATRMMQHKKDTQKFKIFNLSNKFVWCSVAKAYQRERLYCCQCSSDVVCDMRALCRYPELYDTLSYAAIGRTLWYDHVDLQKHTRKERAWRKVTQTEDLISCEDVSIDCSSYKLHFILHVVSTSISPFSVIHTSNVNTQNDRAVKVAWVMRGQNWLCVVCEHTICQSWPLTCLFPHSLCLTWITSELSVMVIRIC